MQVFQLSTIEELASYAEPWDRLAAGMPMRSWTWLSHWWRHYGPTPDSYDEGARLRVLCVFDHADVLVGVAPWYLDRRGGRGRVLRCLGSGEVCSDYLGILCQPAVCEQVVESLADYLAAADCPGADADRTWDLLELSGVDSGDTTVAALLRCLAERGYTVDRRPSVSCWRVHLPATWEAYLATLSKGHRKQLRRLERNWFDTGRAVLHTVERLDQLAGVMDLLIDLHQRRRRGLGQPGCFASPRFAAFHRQVMPALLREGHLQLHWLELDGQAVAAEYHLAGGGIVYAYQAGIAPQWLDHEPGRLITLALLRRAIEQGYRALDFLRGDEPYKAHFRAQPRPMLTVRVVGKRPAARLRHNLWSAGRQVKQWIAR